LRKLFGATQLNVERELEDLYSTFLAQLPIKMTAEEARKDVKDAIEACKEQAKREGTAIWPDNVGDLMLEADKAGHQKYRKIVEKARKEGATDEDIREFWNLNDLQRRMVLWSENVFRYSNFLSLKEDGLSADDAMVLVRKMFPMYGDSEDTTHTSGDDRPLPHELRGRVDDYRQKLGAVFVKRQAEEFTTYNAFVRHEIRAGNL
jgi:hypothetical protein